MIELERATNGPTLTLDDTKDVKTDLTKQCDEVVEQLLTKDLEYSDEDVESPGKEEPEFEEDIANLDTAPLELEELPEMHEDLSQLPASPELENSSILTLPRV